MDPLIQAQVAGRLALVDGTVLTRKDLATIGTMCANGELSDAGVFVSPDFSPEENARLTDVWERAEVYRWHVREVCYGVRLSGFVN